jgi:hypothetical protein
MLHILTPNGKHYKVDKDYNIIRTDIKGFKASGQWKLLGIASVRSMRMVVLAGEIRSWLKRKPSLLYKNGHPQYTIVDYDHGTNRVWGNTVYNGIQKIWEEK